MIRVLIVDNNVELCDTLAEFLNSLSDMTVVGTAHDGEQALKEIRLLLPDVILLDISMPHLDGMAVVERLGSLGLNYDLRIIVLSALASEDVVRHFIALGAHYFVVKPFDLHVLAERIRQFAAPSAPSIMREAREIYRISPLVEEEAQVTRLLHEMGIPPHFKGYKYLRDAVLLVLHDNQLLGGSLTGRLYPLLAEKYASTSGGVEAAIRNSVLASWEGGNRDFLISLTGNLGSPRKKFPTNSVVIAKIADAVRLSKHVS